MAACAKRQAAQSTSVHCYTDDSAGQGPANSGQTLALSQDAGVQSLAARINTTASANALRRAHLEQSSSAVRAWRFPSSRRFLWDRTATGPCLQLHPQVRDQAGTSVVCTPVSCALSSPCCRPVYQLLFLGNRLLLPCKTAQLPHRKCTYQHLGKLDIAMLCLLPLAQVGSIMQETCTCLRSADKRIYTK